MASIDATVMPLQSSDAASLLCIRSNKNKMCGGTSGLQWWCPVEQSMASAACMQGSYLKTTINRCNEAIGQCLNKSFMALAWLAGLRGMHAKNYNKNNQMLR